MAVLTHIVRLVFASPPLRWGGVVAALLWATAPAVPAADAPATREYAIKAAALCNFVPFIQWPADAFPSDDSPVIIGILGPDPFGRLLDGLTEQETFRGHPICVARYRSADDVGACHVLFVSRAAVRAGWRKHSAAFMHRPILTVSDAEGFAQNDGIVEFYTDRNRLRLVINLAAARSAGLNVSSKLLRLADVIREDPVP